MGSGSDLYPHPSWVGVGGVHHRCLLKVHSRLADRHHPPLEDPRRGPRRTPTLFSNKAVLRRPLEPEQYLSVRYTNRLAESQIVAPVGSKGDSYDNALAETTIGLYKTELIRNRGPWRDLDHTTFATLEYIDWFNHRRLHRGITPDTTYTTPAEHETNYHQTNPTTPQIAQTTNPG